MDDRVIREERFHNQAYADGRRERGTLEKIYQVAGDGFAFYKQAPASFCARGTKVLELGCGPGSVARRLAKQGADVTGIDISEVAIEEAKRSANGNQTENVRFCLMNAEELEFEDASFDVILGSGILHHLDLDKALSELARVIRPTGHAVFVECLGHNPLINAYRKLTPALRTEDEHPLLMGDLKLVDRYFEVNETCYFCLCSLAVIPFVGLPGWRLALNLLKRADRTLFRVLPPARKYAWFMGMIMSRPKGRNVR